MKSVYERPKKKVETEPEEKRAKSKEQGVKTGCRNQRSEIGNLQWDISTSLALTIETTSFNFAHQN